MAVRGQATTEAALGILVISTVIVFGIHFSEISILSLKVQEANTSALWDTTAKKMSNLTAAVADFSPRTAAIGAAGADASGKYADFDGRASKAGASPTLVFTQASPITVTCREDNSGILPVTLPGPIAGVYGGGLGGIACVAEADVSLVPNFTRNFLQNQPFRVQETQLGTYHLCSMSRANGNNCTAQTLMLLGDWGLTDGAEANNCDLTGPNTPCANSGFYLMAESIYAGMRSPNPPGDVLSRWLYGPSYGGPPAQTDENAFFMAAVGEDWSNPTPYQLDDPTAHFGFGPYTVTPGGPYDSPQLQSYPQAAQQREPCAFGLPCDPAQWPIY
ncbi:MAG TPA: hypothetical protein VND93_20070 [Myxococcales bacterium]|nr:hypothetical protein [Myxococcales bacterium]